jgi:hypothetical protein
MSIHNKNQYHIDQLCPFLWSPQLIILESALIWHQLALQLSLSFSEENEVEQQKKNSTFYLVWVDHFNKHIDICKNCFFATNRTRKMNGNKPWLTWQYYLNHELWSAIVHADYLFMRYTLVKTYRHETIIPI